MKMLTHNDVDRILNDIEPSLFLHHKDEMVRRLVLADLENFLRIRGTPNLTEEELREYLIFWLMKYRQRCKLIFQNQKLDLVQKSKEITQKGLMYLTDNLTKEEIAELEEIVRITLINHKEICGTNILAEQFVRAEANYYFSTKKVTVIKSSKDLAYAKINLIQSLINRTREACKNSGTLIYIFVNPHYYSVREFRNDKGVTYQL